MQDGYSLEREPYSWTESVSKEELTLFRMEIAIGAIFLHNRTILAGKVKAKTSRKAIQSVTFAIAEIVFKC